MKTSRYRYIHWAIVPLATVFAVPPSELAAQPPGGPNAPDIKLVDEFDANDDGWLNGEERKAALAELKAMCTDQLEEFLKEGPQ